MRLTKFFRKFIAHFHFNPSCHQPDQALRLLDFFKLNPNSCFPYELLKQEIHKFQSLQSHIHCICEAIIDPLIEIPMDIHSLIINKDATRNDSIHNPRVLSLIDLGLNTMKKSKDPFHDISHVARCLKLASVYFATYKKQNDLDWGSLVTAIVFHDISRADNLSFLYNHKFLKPFQYVPFLLDFSLVTNVYSDAERSADIFIKKSKNLKLPKNFVNNVIYGILGTSPAASHLKLDCIYFKIVCDVDKLDLFSIGRFESALSNVLSKKMANMRYFNRSNFLASLMLGQARHNLNLDISTPIFDCCVKSLKYHGAKFYPIYAKILS